MGDFNPLGNFLHEVAKFEVAIQLAFELCLLGPNFRCHVVEAISNDVVDKVGPVEVVFFVLLRSDGKSRVEERVETDVTLPVLAFQLGTGGGSTKSRDG